ncbi:2-keto-4-pentenoate hydratase [Nisaea sp.]|uniref:2-keto-4-pentenoate hydratase n=1 Tax=Nisaea sp. TaxID=2024842 RepID=UPI002B2773C1|nr:fumarylacetoacetate hydrolase family protein [Nisaea sp.]
MMDMDKLGECILAARLDGKMPAQTEHWFGSTDIDDAYNVQNIVLGEIGRRRNTKVIGRKVGCTNQSARDLLGLDGPFHGALLSDTAMASPARIARSDYPFIVLEPEFALRLGKPLGPESAPHTAESVAGAVDAVLPALEIVSSCHTDWTRTGPALVIADNGSSYGWVHGAPVTDWDVDSLMNAEVTLHVDGEQIATGNAGNVDGGPLGVLAWLADRVLLPAGAIVSTGTTTSVHFGDRGERVEARFGKFGEVSVEIV